MTLLNDLATMGEELHLVKSKLQGLSVSTGALDKIRLMEMQAKDLRVSLQWGSRLVACEHAVTCSLLGNQSSWTTLHSMLEWWLPWSCTGLVQAAMSAVRSWMWWLWHDLKTVSAWSFLALALTEFPLFHNGPRDLGGRECQLTLLLCTGTSSEFLCYPPTIAQRNVPDELRAALIFALRGTNFAQVMEKSSRYWPGSFLLIEWLS